MSTFVEAATSTLRARASKLQATSQEAHSIAAQLAAVSQGASVAGTNSTVESLRSALGNLQNQLRNIASHCDEAAGILHGLAQDLDSLEAEGQSKYRRFGSPSPNDAVKYSYYEMLANPQQERWEAQAARSRASRQLDQLAAEAPIVAAKPSEWEIWLQELGNATGQVSQQLDDFGQGLVDATVQVGQEIGGELWRIGTETVTGAVDVVVFVGYSATTQVIIDPEGWKKTWAGVKDTAEYVATHKWDTAKAFVEGVLNVELLKKNPGEWIAVEAIVILATLGTGKAIKVALEAEKVAKIAAVAAAFTKAREGIVPALRDLITAPESAAGQAISQAHPEAFTSLTRNGEAVRRLYEKIPEHIWQAGNADRGFSIEKAISVIWQKTHGADPLPLNTKGIDYFNRTDGTVVQVKSIDTTAKSYQGSGEVTSTIKGYLYNDPKGLQYYTGDKIGPDDTLLPEQVKARQLVVAVPEGGVSPQQADELINLISEAKKNNIDMRVVEVPQ